MALVVATLPAQGASITPSSVEHQGGGAQPDCTAPDVNSPATHYYGVTNPVQVSGDPIEDPNNPGVYITITSPSTEAGADDQSFDFEITDGAGDPTNWLAANVVVKGSKKSNNYDYLNSAIGPQADDDNLIAPKKNPNRFENLSHVSICYDEYITISGTKSHDRDADGSVDPTQEEDLAGWTIKVYSDNDGLGTLNAGDTLAATAVTADGTGTFDLGDYEAIVSGGDYIVCEVLPAGTPDTGGGVIGWLQSAGFPDTTNTKCAADPDSLGLAPGGYALANLTADVRNIDFLNLRQVTLQCGQSATLGGGTTGDPESTVSLPASCDSTSGITSTFDVGTSTDTDAWDQFVVFGGDPSGTVTLTQSIVWNPELAVYEFELANGDICTAGNPGCVPILQVPTTLVRLTSSSELIPVVFCASGDPSAGTPDCLFTQQIDLGGSVPAEMMQITETYKFLGDPPRFR
jgi:hypothetical protein